MVFVELKDPQDWDALMAPCPVCFLTTTSPSSTEPKHNVMVISWLIPTSGRLLLSMNKRRHTASLLGEGSEFGLSIPTQGMEEIICNVGSLSGAWGRSKFPQDNSTATMPTPQQLKTMSKRAKKKYLTENGVPGLSRISIVGGESAFAIDGTAAHIHCKLIQKEENLIDGDHNFLVVEVLKTFVEEKHWDPAERVFSASLSFFGSQTFGLISKQGKGRHKDQPINLMDPWLYLKDGKEVSRLLYPNPICLLAVGNNPPVIVDRLTATNNEGSLLFCASTELGNQMMANTGFWLLVPVKGMEGVLRETQKECPGRAEQEKKRARTEIPGERNEEVSSREILGGDNEDCKDQRFLDCVSSLHCKVYATKELLNNNTAVFAQAQTACVHPSYWDPKKNRFMPDGGCAPCLKRLGLGSFGYLVPSD